jgi:hypothetical protein
MGNMQHKLSTSSTSRRRAGQATLTPQEAQAQAPGAHAALSRIETRKTNEGQKSYSPPRQIASEQNSSTDQIHNKKAKLKTHVVMQQMRHCLRQYE